MSTITNNPRLTWLEYFGLPDDMDETTFADVSSAFSLYLNGRTNHSSLHSNAAVTEERVVTSADFSDYIQRIGNPYRFMAENRPTSHEAVGSTQAADDCLNDDISSTLSKVPEICFQKDFDICVANTFACFSPPNQPYAASLVTLEKLTGYLDTVEITLLSEVSSSSEGFFDALRSYDELNTQVALSCEHIQVLRRRMRFLAKNLVYKSLRLPTLVRRRANTAALNEKLRLVQAVWATQPTLQQLLTARDFSGALELIGSSQQLLSTELSGVSSLRELRVSLAETKRLITGMMSKDLLQHALGYDLDVGAPATPTEALASELEIQLLPLACGLMRLRLLLDALRAFEEQMLRDARGLVKRRLNELMSLIVPAPAQESTSGAEVVKRDEKGGVTAGCDDSGANHDVSGGATPAKRTIHAQVRELSVEAFEEVMSGITAPLLVLLRRASLVRSTLMSALVTPQGQAAALAADAVAVPEAAERDRDIPSAGGGATTCYTDRIEHQSSELLQHVCEVALDRYARLLKVRREVHSHLNLVDFCRMSSAVDEFVRDVDHLCPLPHSSLSTELKDQAVEFLRVAHETNVAKLETVIEMEQWKQVEVAPEFQEIVDAFVRNQVPQQTESDLMRLRADAVKQPDPSAAEGEVSGAVHEIVIGGTGFKCVGSLLLLLTMSAQYLQCVMLLRSVSAQVAHLLPSLFKVFHTLVYKQVLMAGAMRQVSAGLKAITFKHLALASQSLCLLLDLLPHFKAVIAAYLPETQRDLLHEVDTVQADFDKHQQELIAKFVAIVEDRRKDHVSKLGETLAPSEDRKRPEASTCVKVSTLVCRIALLSTSVLSNRRFQPSFQPFSPRVVWQLVAKDVQSMHKQLSPVLSRQQLHAVFVQVCSGAVHASASRSVCCAFTAPPACQGLCVSTASNPHAQVLGAFDTGLLSAYTSVDASALFTRQCIVADVLYLRNEVTKLHLALPQGVCPELTSFAKTLNVKA